MVGIAGSYGDKIPCGEALVVNEAVCHGVGVGDGDQHKSASEVGWPMMESPLIHNRIRLPKDGGRAVLTCCTSSDSIETANVRHGLYGDAFAEDMESFSVALSCRLANVPLTIVRGISNRAGDRDHANWKIAPALASATELAIRWLRDDDDE